MAEFCKKCAYKYGFRPDSKPLLCEGCGQYFDRVSLLQKLKKLLKALNIF